MKSKCILTNVVDGDMTIINCFNETGEQVDTVVIGGGDIFGEPIDSEIAEMMGLEGGISGNPDFWKPLLIENYTWEQLQGTCNSDYDFKEDAVSRMASFLGMDKEAIQPLGNWETNNIVKDRVITQHFKKISVKKPSLKTVVNQVFGEALEPLGFVTLKEKHPYFVRLIGDEVLHVIACAHDSHDTSKEKRFIVYAGVATLYRQSIYFKKSPRDINDWLSEIRSLYGRLNLTNWGDEFFKSIRNFSYEDEIIVAEAKRALEITERIILPILNEVVSLDSCIEFFYKYKCRLLDIWCDEKYGYFSPYRDHNEGLLLIKTKNRDDGIKRMNEMLAGSSRPMKEGKIKLSQEFIKKQYERTCENYNKWRIEQIALRDNILDTPELYAEILTGLERRKATNIETLRSYGLNI